MRDDFDYNAYGEFERSGTTTILPYAFRGRRFDAETGFYLMGGGTYLDPQVGRTISRGHGALGSLYAWGANNLTVMAYAGLNCGLLNANNNVPPGRDPDEWEETLEDYGKREKGTYLEHGPTRERQKPKPKPKPKPKRTGRNWLVGETIGRFLDWIDPPTPPPPPPPPPPPACPDLCRPAGKKKNCQVIGQRITSVNYDPDTIDLAHDAAGTPDSPEAAAVGQIIDVPGIGNLYVETMNYGSGVFSGWSVWTKVKFQNCASEPCGSTTRLNWLEQQSGYIQCGLGIGANNANLGGLSNARRMLGRCAQEAIRKTCG